MRSHSNRGFTLIELMIVVAIIAIIASIAIPSLLSARSNANEKAVIATLRSIVTAQELARTNVMVDTNNNGLGEAAGIGELTGTEVIRGTATYLRPPPPAEARFIVVEAPDRGVPRAANEPASAAAVSVSEPTMDAPPAGPARVASPGRTGRAPKSATSGALSRALARHERALGACFDRHAAQLEGTPEIAIRFEAAPSGAVRSAALVPGSLEGTALGSCLLEVARGVAFGKLDQTTRFTIPIHASNNR